MRPTDTALSDVEFAERALAADVPLQMTEGAFAALYERTARPLWSYLFRLSGDSAAADDLLQESYYRFLRAGSPPANDAHQRHLLFRIATNLATDRVRRLVTRPEGTATAVAEPAARTPVDTQLDVMRTMARLGQRERALLWLAYVDGSSHAEIATVLGLRPGSIKTLLFRARQRFLRHLGVDRKHP
jgi:RNA polymerase sigma-70 factor (ECF subfamily)